MPLYSAGGRQLEPVGAAKLLRYRSLALHQLCCLYGIDCKHMAVSNYGSSSSSISSSATRCSRPARLCHLMLLLLHCLAIGCCREAAQHEALRLRGSARLGAASGASDDGLVDTLHGDPG